ncbi:hypothetical protein Tco_1217495 [Tanacetum coccineum]
MDEDQARPDPRESHVALAELNPEPTHDDFMDNVYPNIHESLKFPADEHVILEDPLSSSGTLFSMKNLDDAYTIGDQLLNDKSTEDESRKLNVEAEVLSMVTVPFYQASSSVPPLSTLVIDLSPPKPVPSTTQAPILWDLPHKIIQTVNEVIKEVVHVALQALLRDHFRELPEADMKEILHQRMFESGTYRSLPKHVALYEALEASMERANMDEFFAEKDKSLKRRREDQDPPPLPPDSDMSKKKRHDSDASGSTQSLAPQSSAWKTSNTREAPSNSSKQKSAHHSEQLVDDMPIPDDVNISDLEDTDTAHLPKIEFSPDWLKPAAEEDRPATPEPDWFQMEECHLLLTDQVDLVNPEGYRVVPDVRKPLPLRGSKEIRSALSISKPKAANYPDFRLEELVPSLWIKSERKYNISAAYGISYWWFKRKELYITRHSAPSDRNTVRSHMRILSVVSLKTYERYRYTFLKEIVLHRADYKEYKISKADFKNMHPNDFEDLYLLHLQGQVNHLSGADKVHPFNADASDFLFKEDYTIVSKPRAVIYKDKNDQKEMMRETEVHKFSDGTLNKILGKLDHMVKDFKLFKFNPSMETRI